MINASACLRPHDRCQRPSGQGRQPSRDITAGEPHRYDNGGGAGVAPLARPDSGEPPGMLNLEMSWQEAAVTSGCLFAATGVTRRLRPPRLIKTMVFAREVATMTALFALWQFAGSYSVMAPDRALARADWLWRAERSVHLPNEAVIQRFFLPHPLLVQFFNLYYAALHFAVLIALLIWLFVRHRPRYPRVRTTVVLFTAGSLLVQLIPVAPPRMLPAAGMVDTAILYGQSVYGSVAGFNADEYSAMPSVHIGWALLVALVVVTVSRSRWRWLMLAYPVMTTLVVVVTANHFWLDGGVAAALLAVVLLLQRLTPAAHRLRQALEREAAAAGHRLRSTLRPRVPALPQRAGGAAHQAPTPQPAPGTPAPAPVPQPVPVPQPASTAQRHPALTAQRHPAPAAEWFGRVMRRLGRVVVGMGGMAGWLGGGIGYVTLPAVLMADRAHRELPDSPAARGGAQPSPGAGIPG
jgi:PAP2 superfamily protein